MVAVKYKPEDAERPDKTRLRKTIYLLPNLFTAGNMVLGILSITFAINDSLTLSLAAETKVVPFVLSAQLIVVAAFLDFFDGFLARATGTTSKFGMEFDSLSDLVSFGMAPALLIYLSVLRYLPFWGISIAVLYVVCAAIRLARFNVQAQVEEKSHFMGLPSPAAAGILASYILFSHWVGWYGEGIIMNKVMGWYEENLYHVELYGIPVLTVLIALVMISTIAYPSLKKKWTKETISPITLVMIAVFILCIWKMAELTSFVVLTSYLFFGIFKFLMKKSFGRLRDNKTAKPLKV